MKGTLIDSFGYFYRVRVQWQIATQWAKDLKLLVLWSQEYSHSVGSKLLLFINSPASGILLEQPQSPMVATKWRQQEIFINPQEALSNSQDSTPASSFQCTEPRMNAYHIIHTSYHLAWMVLKTLLQGWGTNPGGNRLLSKTAINSALHTTCVFLHLH